MVTSPVRLVLAFFLIFVAFLPVFALPTHDIQSLSKSLDFQRLVRRLDAVLTTNANGTSVVVNPKTRQAIPQGPATDGAGNGFDAPAVIWIAFSLVLGGGLSLVGFRGWRITTGISLGLVGAVCAWAAVINAVNHIGVTDVVVVMITLAFFFIAFLIGVFDFARPAAIIALCITGGFSVGLRVVLLRPGLLFGRNSLYPVNWVIVGSLAVVLGLMLMRSIRAAILLACAANGSFLLALGLDLVLNRQSGMSRGLRYLFDRNSNHFADIMKNGYNPRVTTLIIIGASLAIIPPLAFGQHKIFRDGFDRTPVPSDDELAVNYPNADFAKNVPASGFWNTLKNPRSRFSM